MHWTPLLLALLSCSLLFAQEKEGRRITETLCSEGFFGRGYVQGGDSLAALFLADEFEKRGLIGLNKSNKPSAFLQPFSFSINTFPDTIAVLANNKPLQLGVDYLVEPSSGSSFSTLVPHWIAGESLFIPAFREELNRNQRGKRSWNALVIDATNLNGDSLQAVKQFAISWMDVSPVFFVSKERLVHSLAQTQRLFPLVLLQPDVIHPSDSLFIDVRAVLKTKHTANNVIVQLPATKKTKKTIYFVAHYDHLGGLGPNVYFPGANDNASGTSMLFALADELKKQKRRKYNSVFIAFAGEEVGLLGSKYYVENPLTPLKNIRFLLNLDIMGSGEDGITVVNGSVHKTEFDLLTKINADKKYLKQVKPRGSTQNSDHYWFSQKGVSTFFIYTMGPNKHYHDTSDRYENLSFQAYSDILKLLMDFQLKL